MLKTHEGYAIDKTCTVTDTCTIILGVACRPANDRDEEQYPTYVVWNYNPIHGFWNARYANDFAVAMTNYYHAIKFEATSAEQNYREFTKIPW